MKKRALGRSGLEISPLVFGGNVFGWTADEPTSFKLLDQFVDHGFDAIDTADVYSRWVEGHHGGESETIIGDWLATNPGKREKVKIFTKVGGDMGDGKSLSERWIIREVEESLSRLKTDYIDLYFSHWPDADTPYAETLGAYKKLIEEGKIRAAGASNLDAEQMEEALEIASSENLPRYEVLQPHYNLYDRAKFEGPLQDFCIENEIGVVTYFSLASGFLSGKYRSKDDLGKSARGAGIEKYLDQKGMQILAALDDVAARHGAKPAEVALAFVMQQQGVTAPIASATNESQLNSLAKAAGLTLSQEDLQMLDDASAAV